VPILDCFSQSFSTANIVNLFGILGYYQISLLCNRLQLYLLNVFFP
jgi:hypothetical protein